MCVKFWCGKNSAFGRRISPARIAGWTIPFQVANVTAMILVFHLPWTSLNFLILKSCVKMIFLQKEVDQDGDSGKATGEPNGGAGEPNGGVDKTSVAQRMEQIYKRLEFIDAYSAEARAASILAVSFFHLHNWEHNTDRMQFLPANLTAYRIRSILSNYDASQLVCRNILQDLFWFIDSIVRWFWNIFHVVHSFVWLGDGLSQKFMFVSLPVLLVVWDR